MLSILVDEDTKAKSLIRLLQEAGHDVLTTADVGLDGNPDDGEVLARAKKEKRIVLTRNCGDFALLHQQSADHSGIFMIRSQMRMPMSHDDIVRSIANIIAAKAPIEGQCLTLNDWQY